MPSGLAKGPEKRRRTRRDGIVWFETLRGRAVCRAASEASEPSGGRLGGWDWSPSHRCAIASVGLDESSQGKRSSSK
eukprot:5503309-Pleurochrysis_carterae.AAC.1